MNDQPRHNALCPCGSGMKYLGCCYPLHLKLSRVTRTMESLTELKHEVAEKNQISEDEAEKFLEAFQKKSNIKPRELCLGLSPDQLCQMVDMGFALTSGLVVFRTDIPAADLAGIPVVSGVVRFLKEMAAAGPLRATPKGCLPREFARILFEELEDSEVKQIVKFRSEEDSRIVFLLRHLLLEGKWIAKKKGVYRLTRKGIRVAENGMTGEDYVELLLIYISGINWTAMDGFPGYEIIQFTALFSLYLLKRKAESFIKSYSLTPYLIQAFPMILGEVPRHEWTDEFSDVDRCWSLRFLERFCLFFGLIKVKGEGPNLLERTMTLKTTPLFDRLIGWRTGHPAVH